MRRSNSKVDDQYAMLAVDNNEHMIRSKVERGSRQL
jgi:hypothetical protein